MRISTTMLYDMGASRISEMQGGMVKTQQQISTMRRILTPSDDPIGAARVLELSQGKSINEQFAVNRNQAKNLLSQEEGALTTLTSLVQDVQEAVIKAGNPSLGDEQRQYLALELQGRFEELMGIANSRDGGGHYIFGGYNISNQPFVMNSGGVTYNGDQGQRTIKIGSSHQVALSDSGSDVFQRIRTGNGTFATAAEGSNTGTGVISTGNVIDHDTVKNHEYEIAFSVVGGVTSYTVTDISEIPSVTYPAVTFEEGEGISFDGIQFEISGQPAAGDVFTVKPSSNKDVFSTLQGLIDALNKPVQGGSGRAELQNELNKANVEMSSMLDNVLSVRASVGARLQEIEHLDNAGLDRDLYYAEAISDLQDLDYVKALSDLARQQVALEAAQKTFVTVSGLSLFKML